MLFQVVFYPAVGALDAGDTERVDMAVEGIGDATHVPADAKRSCVEVDGLGIAHLRDARAVEIETLVVGAGVLVVGAGVILAPGAVPERARDVVL